MNNRAFQAIHLAAFVVAATVSSGAFAQKPPMQKSVCQAVGFSPQEPVGDRDGHTYSVSSYSCQNQGGDFDGAILTGSTIWESEKGSSVALAGSGVIRRPGMSAVFVLTDGKSSLTMADGKVTGFSGTAKGVYKVAAGAAASLAGKTFSSTFRSTAGGQFVIETVVD
ncbi:hypothetical protein QTI24_29865 [Variovorax sp. J22P240]|uniref:hypothetical protein n=1 Tax=Variovorax sp. J22P240 TaxID=3053514 RepID=UPI002577297C|nr:hypothetical protein [Variovorax sp. J22P240]MDM0002831.1 hypothetical protein [Variovorax sp. J22P240]